METEELTIGRVHHGRNIRRTRIEKNIDKQRIQVHKRAQRIDD